MPYLPPYDLLFKWLDTRERQSDGGLVVLYDDLLDVLRCYVAAVPVDADWYMAQYPGVAAFIARTATATAASHFTQHGYFEGRHPFELGWRGYTLPEPFSRLKTRLKIVPHRGRIVVDVSRDDILDLVRSILHAVPVEAAWYTREYHMDQVGCDLAIPHALNTHFAIEGYFLGRLPADIEVDADWYLTQYDHVRRGLERGVAADAKDHFLRIGYREGCRPTAPS